MANRVMKSVAMVVLLLVICSCRTSTRDSTASSVWTRGVQDCSTPDSEPIAEFCWFTQDSVDMLDGSRLMLSRLRFLQDFMDFKAGETLVVRTEISHITSVPPIDTIYIFYLPPHQENSPRLMFFQSCLSPWPSERDESVDSP